MKGDPAYRAARDADPDGRLVHGVRFARHQAVHGELVAELTEGRGVIAVWGASAWGATPWGVSGQAIGPPTAK
jgi:hypothetical protein